MVRFDLRQSNPLEDTLRRICPRDHSHNWIHNTVADTISRLDYDPKLNSTNEYNHATHVRTRNEEGCQKWLMFSKFCTC